MNEKITEYRSYLSKLNLLDSDLKKEIFRVEEMFKAGHHYEALIKIDELSKQYEDNEKLSLLRQHCFEYILYLIDPKVPLNDNDTNESLSNREGYEQVMSFLRGESFMVYSLYNLLMDKGIQEAGIYVLENAAKRDFSNAQYQLGSLYQDGIFFEKDELEALYWYHKSALQNNRFGLNALGRAYYEGLGTTINYNYAFKYLSKAYDLGITESIGDIGYMYYMGLGTPKNKRKAYEMWMLGKEKEALNCQEYLDAYFTKQDKH